MEDLFVIKQGVIPAWKPDPSVYSVHLLTSWDGRSSLGSHVDWALACVQIVHEGGVMGWSDNLYPYLMMVLVDRWTDNPPQHTHTRCANALCPLR